MECNTNIEKLMYSPEEIATILMKKRTATYDYLRNVYEEGKPFRVIKIGNSYRIPKKSFDAWINQM